MGVANRLVSFVCELDYDTLREEVILAAKNCILDTLGVAIASLQEQSSRLVLNLVSSQAGSPESTVIGTSRGYPSSSAALANGALAHALDLDDTHDLAVLHSGVSVIPSALAMAERNQATGKEFLLAVIAGYDVHSRLGLATKVAPGISGWHYTSVCGVFGAAAAAGRILKLNQNKMQNALGIAYSHASGTLISENDGTWAKRLQPGIAAEGGVRSALLASEGFTGPADPFEAKLGLFNVYLRDFDSSKVTEKLGSRFEVARTSLKLYPCCRFSHAAIAGTLHLVREENIQPEMVERVRINLTPSGYSEICFPMEEKIHPRTTVQAQFSLPFLVAAAIRDRDVFIDTFQEKELNDSRLLRLAERVEPVIDKALEVKYGPTVCPNRVEITTKSGDVFATTAFPEGSPDRPLTSDQIRNKFRKCASHGNFTGVSQNLIEAIDSLESLDTVTKIGCLLRIHDG
jgi:2-methylcitrate dehydratase PrpD